MNPLPSVVDASGVVKASTIVGGGTRLNLASGIFTMQGSDQIPAYINTNTKDTNLNVDLEGKTINNLTINNLNSNQILLNSTSGSQYNIETTFVNTASEQTVQNDRISALENEIDHIISDLTKYVTPRMYPFQQIFSLSRADFISDIFQIAPQELIFKAPYSYDSQMNYLGYGVQIPEYKHNEAGVLPYYMSIPGFVVSSPILQYNTAVFSLKQLQKDSYTIPKYKSFGYLNNTSFFKDGLFFFYGTGNNQVIHVNDYDFDLIQINSGCTYNCSFKLCYQFPQYIEDTTVEIDGQICLQYDYPRLGPNIGTFVCMKRNEGEEFDSSQFETTSVKITSLTKKQYDSQFVQGQIVIGLKDSTDTRSDISMYANTFCIKLNEMSLNEITLEQKNLSSSQNLIAYVCSLNFDYEQLVDQVGSLTDQVNNLEQFKTEQLAKDNTYEINIANNARNITTNTTNIVSIQQQLVSINNTLQSYYDEITENIINITQIQNDYLKNSDKQELQEQIDDNTTDIEVLESSALTYNNLSANYTISNEYQALNLKGANQLYNKIASLEVGTQYTLGQIITSLFNSDTMKTIAGCVFLLCNGQQIPTTYQTFIDAFPNLLGYTPDFHEVLLRGTSTDSSFGRQGSNMITLTPQNIPPHGHAINLTTSSAGTHKHDLYVRENAGGSAYVSRKGNTSGGGWMGMTNTAVGENGEHTHTISGTTDTTGAGQSFMFEPVHYSVMYYICVQTPFE